MPTIYKNFSNIKANNKVEELEKKNKTLNIICNVLLVALVIMTGLFFHARLQSWSYTHKLYEINNDCKWNFNREGNFVCNK